MQFRHVVRLKGEILFIMFFLHNKLYEVNLKSFKNRINTKFFDCQLWEADKKAKKTRYLHNILFLKV